MAGYAAYPELVENISGRGKTLRALPEHLRVNVQIDAGTSTIQRFASGPHRHIGCRNARRHGTALKFTATWHGLNVRQIGANRFDKELLRPHHYLRRDHRRPTPQKPAVAGIATIS